MWELMIQLMGKKEKYSTEKTKRNEDASGMQNQECFSYLPGYLFSIQGKEMWVPASVQLWLGVQVINLLI